MNFHSPFRRFQKLSPALAGKSNLFLKIQLEPHFSTSATLDYSHVQRMQSLCQDKNFQKQYQYHNIRSLKHWSKYLDNVQKVRGKQWEHHDQNQRHVHHACLLLFGFGVISASWYSLLSKYFSEDDIDIIHTMWPSVHADKRNKNNFIADVVEKAAPAVVFLEIKGRHPRTGLPVSVSNGSGFIVRENGVILTNAHVVANKSSISVKLENGKIYEGQVTAVDPVSDLATVKIPANNLPFISLANSSAIRPGEWVIAMGSPLSFSNTVTCGIVSSVHRGSKELGLRNRDMDYIQTDAVINFGNSGGPLVNLEGRAIGINTMKVTTGISFAIPSDHSRKFLVRAEEVIKNGKKSPENDSGRRYMGITMLSLTDSIIEELKKDEVADFRDVHAGVLVYKVIPGSPAHTGGILAGDIILEIEGKPVKSAADVYDAVGKMEKLLVTIIRGQSKRKTTIDTKEAI